MSRNCWAVISLAALAIGLTALLFRLLASDNVIRKTALWIVVAASFVLAISLCFALHRPAREAVVMSAAATVKTSPEPSAVDAFVLYEGIEVLVVSELGSWREVRLADGNTGWVVAAVIEEVR